MAGHPGITGTYELLGRMYTWPKMKEYVTAYKGKEKEHKRTGKTPTVAEPDDALALDRIGSCRTITKVKGKGRYICSS